MTILGIRPALYDPSLLRLKPSDTIVSHAQLPKTKAAISASERMPTSQHQAILDFETFAALPKVASVRFEAHQLLRDDASDASAQAINASVAVPAARTQNNFEAQDREPLFVTAA